ncbi:CLAVATA3/ESR (CLE)-related protein 13 [Raphanus sativus]|uniref:CLAVATA3/ESR (CLE)-related protein 13 n=1 Tax=Raphanus sativus TaxID=3726 RepID=W6EB21_RAPSA|nr:CLAVATA3/ESR (CLE)-related protein 13 [Raphanus sativus]AHJ09720.1 CLE13 protein [Raphanus sativus]KAJ4875070.1 CLAVATA3/ESR (CLE)-related protein 13 [Raphanus sativus]
MATSRVSHVLGSLLCISLLLLLVSEGFFVRLSSMSSLKPYPSPVISSLRPGRRAFVVSKFDFTPFMDLRGQDHQDVSQLGGSDIDPIYGVEKRLVPSGPNPLHH